MSLLAFFSPLLRVVPVQYQLMFECCLNGDWWKSDYVPASLKKTKDVSGYYGVFIMPPTAVGQWHYVFGLSIRLMNMISQEFHGGISSKGHNFPPDSRMNWLVFSSQRSLWPYKSCFWSRLHTLIMANDTQMSKKITWWSDNILYSDVTVTS